MSAKRLKVPEISIIIPFFNEEGNVEKLHEEVTSVLDDNAKSYELVYIDDGGTDQTRSIIEELAKTNKKINFISLQRNSGQTAALQAGIDNSNGKIIIVLDGDGQNDPRDIPMLLEKLNDGFDVISGWRKNRRDNAFVRTIPSRCASLLISIISGVKLHDYGCSLKVYKREVLKDIKFYGDMHRFIPIFVSWQGGRISEAVVNHRSRTSGQSKYGLNRIFKVILDLALIVFLDKYATKPIQFFGTFGLFFFLFAVLSGVFSVYLKFVHSISFISTPLPLVTVTLFSTAITSILLGITSEIVMRTYFEAQEKTTYAVKKKD